MRRIVVGSAVVMVMVVSGSAHAATTVTRSSTDSSVLEVTSAAEANSLRILRNSTGSRFDILDANAPVSSSVCTAVSSGRVSCPNNPSISQIRVTTGAGNDSVNAIERNLPGLRIVAGSGNDAVILGSGNQHQVQGGDGNDQLTGGDGADVLLGEQGDDFLFGGGGGDTLDGSGGNDTLSGGDGSDQLDGSSGDDLLTGGNDSDRISSGGSSSIGGDRIDGGPGDDQLTGLFQSAVAQYSGRTGPLRYDQAASVITLPGETDRISNIPHVRGTSQDDILIGGSSNNILQGGPGNDVIQGGAGSDLASYENAAAPVVARPASSGNGVTGENDTIADDIEGLIGSRFDDSLVSAGLPSRLFGRAGNDTLVGGAGFDELFGEEGADRLDASAGHGSNSLDGGLGNDTLIGGTTGFDTATFGTRTQGITVTFDAAGATLSTGEHDTHSGMNAVEGTRFADTLTGGPAVDFIVGGFGDDVLRGGGGNDDLQGGMGSDRLEGGEGQDVLNDNGQDTTALRSSDRLFGGPGNDQLNSGEGQDVLDGGEGGDTLNGGDGLLDRADYSARTTPVVASRTGSGDDGGEEDGAPGSRDTIGLDVEEIAGGSGADRLTGSTGSETLIGGKGADELRALDGNDIVDAVDGEPDIVDCGLGFDFGRLDLKDLSPTGCEDQDVAPVDQFLVVRLLSVSGRRLAVRIACPRKAPKACTGSLTATSARGTRLAIKRFSVPRGRTTRVALRMRSGPVPRGRVRLDVAARDARGRRIQVRRHLAVRR